MKGFGPDAHDTWHDEHREHCQKHFAVRPGMMEVEGARVLWGCSVEKHKMRFTTMLS